jgi:hypothetical protein
LYQTLAHHGLTQNALLLREVALFIDSGLFTTCLVGERRGRKISKGWHPRGVCRTQQISTSVDNQSPAHFSGPTNLLKE